MFGQPIIKHIDLNCACSVCLGDKSVAENSMHTLYAYFINNDKVYKRLENVHIGIHNLISIRRAKDENVDLPYSRMSTHSKESKIFYLFSAIH